MDISYEQLSKLEEEHGSSFFVLDLEQLDENYRRLIRALSGHYGNVNLAYSYKTNYIPRLVEQLDKLGAYAEVASKMEYQLALECRVSPDRIIFNGPVKDRNDLDYALSHGSMVNIDNLFEMQEILKIARTKPTQRFKVGLRCNFDLKDGSYSRFGLCLENGDLKRAFEQLKETPNCEVVGLHCHYSTSNRTLASFNYRATKLVDISLQLFQDHSPAYLNLGGGIFGPMDEHIKQQFDCYIPSYEEYAETVGSILKRHYANEGPQLILEPGVGMVSNVLHCYARILHLKTVRGRNYAICSASVHNVKPSLHNKELSVERIARSVRDQEVATKDYEIVGYTCLEYDKLLDHYHGPLAEGDFIKLLNVGAYTIVFKSPFIKPAPAILYTAQESQTLKVAQRTETFEDLFRMYVIRERV